MEQRRAGGPSIGSMRAMKAIIIDDEAPARREQRPRLADFPWIDIIGEAGKIAQAAAMIEERQPPTDHQS
jgi:hypothetical protein